VLWLKNAITKYRVGWNRISNCRSKRRVSMLEKLTEEGFVTIAFDASKRSSTNLSHGAGKYPEKILAFFDSTYTVEYEVLQRSRCSRSDAGIKARKRLSGPFGWMIFLSAW